MSLFYSRLRISINEGNCIKIILDSIKFIRLRTWCTVGCKQVNVYFKPVLYLVAVRYKFYSQTVDYTNHCVCPTRDHIFSCLYQSINSPFSLSAQPQRDFFHRRQNIGNELWALAGDIVVNNVDFTSHQYGCLSSTFDLQCYFLKGGFKFASGTRGLNWREIVIRMSAATEREIFI